VRFGVVANLAIFCAVAFEAMLLIFDGRVLVHQTTVNPGEKYVVEGWGDLGQSSQASLACTYFTGRGLVSNVFWFSQNGILGKDQCPLLSRS
jgi:hypothetical protein